MGFKSLATASRARVLLVDDSSLVRLYYRGILEKGALRLNRLSTELRPWRRFWSKSLTSRL